MTTAHDMLFFAHRLADAAAEVLRHYFRVPISVEAKADASPVTQADREAEAAMRALIMREYPAHGIYGEEGEHLNPHAALQWVLDPIDGTRSFIAGYVNFTTLISLTEHGVPILGIIDQPILRERWVGIKGEPSTFNGLPTRTSPLPSLDKATLATTSLDYFTSEQRISFENTRAHAASTLYGGDAYAYAMLASGHIGCVVDAGLKSYDFCALAPVITGAGGIITDWSGKALTLDAKGDVAAASNPAMHAALLNHLHP